MKVVSIKSFLTLLCLALMAGQLNAQGWGVDDEDDQNVDNKQTTQWGQRARDRMNQRQGGQDQADRGGRGMGQGQGRGMGDGRGMGEGPGGMFGGGRGTGMMGGRGMFGPPMETEELMTFLQKYDQQKAAQLNEMYQKQPEQFAEYVGMVCELYTPAARIMENDQDAGKLEVKKISLSLDVKKQVSDYKAATDDAAKNKLKSELSTNLSKQFDLIMESQKSEISMWKERLDRFESRAANGQGQGQGQQQNNNRPGWARDGMSDRFERMQKRMTSEVEKREADIQKWKEQKDQIVERQLSDLVEEVRPFPWN